MVTKVEFASYLADAYEHIYDLVYLRNHPLADLLVAAPSLTAKQRARQLHTLLLGTIQELDPGPQAPVFSHEWRRHRVLMLRYVKGLNPQAVADELIISLRHYYRVHNAAMEDVANVLWDRYLSARPAGAPDASSGVERDAAESPSRLELLRLEAARMAQADRYARVGDVITGVLPLLRDMLRQRRLDVRLALHDSLPGVSIDQSLLRQMLLGMLGYLIERAQQATIRVTAQVEGSLLFLSLTVEPPETPEALVSPDSEERLSALEEMAALGGVHIVPFSTGGRIVGFELQLPTAEHTVLVVDDNEDVLRLFQRQLSPHHYRVVTAQSAQDALDKARQLQPYAITLDLMMPDQDGWSLMQALLNQSTTSHIPVIVCSVLRQKDLALSLGATAFLEKPVSEERLLSVLAALAEP